ncbi:MAG: sodium:solute symporter family protein [Acidobacteria bacterium]|nr:sodium:solute symporter family protein [Acidobacteriota bacterium]
MTGQVAVVLAIVAAYMLAIVLIGYTSGRASRATMEDFHMAGRQLKTLVLFSTVFGANISAVTFIGHPGNAYHVGWVAWPYFVTSWAWMTPMFFYLLGRRAWPLGVHFGHMTISEIVAGRWKSPGLAVLIAVIIIVYTVPYLMTGLTGAGITLQALTDGFIPFWAGALAVSVVVMIYLIMGGMRGAAWVNTLQTAVFIVGGVLIFVVIAQSLGGPAAATEKVIENFPELYRRDRMGWKQFFSYGLVTAFCVPMFPQVFMRLLTGQNPKALRQIMMIYPAPAFLIFFSMAFLGMWGHALIPNLQGREADAILPLLLSQYAPTWAMGVLGAAVFSAMMSTMDSQLLSLTTIIVRDFLTRTKFRGTCEKNQVRISRVLVLALTVVSFVLSLRNPLAIIRIVEFAFAGFACLLAPTIAALYWKRCTKQAAIWSVIVSQVVLLGLTFGWFGLQKSWTFGFLPALPAMISGAGVLILLGFLSGPADDEGTRQYFSFFEELVKRSA